MPTTTISRAGTVSLNFNSDTHMVRIEGRLAEVRQALDELGQRESTGTPWGNRSTTATIQHRKPMSAATRAKIGAARRKQEAAKA